MSVEEPAFPTSAGAITPEWITAALRSSGAITTVQKVVEINVSPIGAGAGFMGSVARLSLTYSGDSAPVSSVVVKSAAPDEATRELVRGYRNYEREVGFFQHLADELGEGVPRCYAAQIDQPTNHFVLVIEDLSDGFRDGDQVAGATLQEALDCLDVQAALHAHYWNALARPELDWVPRVDGDFYAATMMSAFVPGWAGITERFPELIPDGLRDLGLGFPDQVPALTRAMAQCPQTLVHSDFRLDNIMFARDPGALPVKVLDWQGILVSAGVHDVAFLLSQNLADGVRREHESELVEHYHRALVAQGIDDYPLERLWEDYRVAVLLEWVYAVIIGGTLPMTGDRTRALFAAMVARSGEAIIDLDALSLLESLPR